MSEWRWTPDGSARDDGPLRYEPGNWGDILKNAWLARVLAALLERRSDTRPLRALDAFAGRPDYPLAEASHVRVEAAAALFGDAEAAVGGRFLSSSSFVRREASRRGARVELAVFDLEPEFRAAWAGLDDVEVLDVASGDDALRLDAASRADLVLVDPYDLFDDWRHRIDAAVELARGRAVLLYLYDKSPRGSGHREQYAALDCALASATRDACVGGMSGSVPSDAVAPRARHEVRLIGPTDLVNALRDELDAVTTSLGEVIGAAP